jgi:peptidoglycan/LPS O-acetylase OafA/YrhL
MREHREAGLSSGLRVATSAPSAPNAGLSSGLRVATSAPSAPNAAAALPRAASGKGLDPLPRVKALDGVRGLAILLVMIHHYTFLPKALPLLDLGVYSVSKLGWSGVDLFFVLSGYLITSILLEYKDDAKYYSAFYGRRILRILPLYYVVVALTFYVLPRFVRLGEIIGSPLWYWFHLSNIHIGLNQFSHKSLDVAWSLAIEEQFYLIWPLVVRLTPTRRLAEVCLTVMWLSAFCRLVLGLGGAPWVMNYTLTPCRLDGLALGSFLACVPAATLQASGKIALRVGVVAAAVVGAVLIVAGNPHMDGKVTPSIGYAALAVLWGSVLVMALSIPVVTRIFSSKALVFFGKYSYGLYLLHLPVGYYLRDNVYGPKQWPRVFGSLLVGQLLFHLLAGSVSVLVAMISWRVLEEPILRLKKYFRYARM